MTSLLGMVLAVAANRSAAAFTMADTTAAMGVNDAAAGAGSFSPGKTLDAVRRRLDAATAGRPGADTADGWDSAHGSRGSNSGGWAGAGVQGGGAAHGTSGWASGGNPSGHGGSTSGWQTASAAGSRGGSSGWASGSGWQGQQRH